MNRKSWVCEVTTSGTRKQNHRKLFMARLLGGVHLCSHVGVLVVCVLKGIWYFSVSKECVSFPTAQFCPRKVSGYIFSENVGPGLTCRLSFVESSWIRSSPRDIVRCYLSESEEQSVELDSGGIRIFNVVRTFSLTYQYYYFPLNVGQAIVLRQSNALARSFWHGLSSLLAQVRFTIEWEICLDLICVLEI